MKTLIFLCHLLVSLFIFSVSAADTYTVNTKSKLNMRSGPGKSYSLVTQVKPGATVTMIEDKGGDWVKVECNGSKGYVMKEYLVLSGQKSVPSKSSKYSISDDPQNKWLLWAIVVLFGILIVNNICEITENRFFVGVIYLSLPSAIILYSLTTPDAMWFCDPDVVGWIKTIINVILLIIALMVCWSTFWGTITDVFADFSFMLLLISLLFGAATLFIVITAIKELLIVAVIMLLGAGSGSTKLGTFIDNDGNVYDVFRK